MNDTLSAFSKLNPFGAICILWKPTAECCAQRCNDWLSQHAGGGPITKWSPVNPLVGNALATCNSPPVLTSFLSFVKWHFLGSRFGELVFNNVLRGIFDGSFRKHHMGLTVICHLFLIKGPNLLSLELPIFYTKGTDVNGNILMRCHTTQSFSVLFNLNIAEKAHLSRHTTWYSNRIVISCICITFSNIWIRPTLHHLLFGFQNLHFQ